MLPTVLIALLAFAVLLVLIARLQHGSRSHAAHAVEQQLADARRRGSDRPLAQHPLIDPALCAGCALCVAACPEDQVLGMRHGRAVLVHGSRCIGHGLCAEACPVGAIAVGLGALAEREDVPRLSPDLESSVPGLFIAGELGGLALIRNAVDQGVAAVGTIARRIAAEPHAPRESLDLLIVGGGPAGIAAALRAHQLELRYVAIEQEGSLGGSLLHYPRHKLTLLQPFALPLFGQVKAGEMQKEEVLQLFTRVVGEHRLRLELGERLLQVRRSGGELVVATSAGERRARHVLLAMGRRGTPRRLEVPGEDLPKVAYRLTDASSYRRARVLVVGGGDSAVEAALALASQPDVAVTLSYRKEAFFRLKARNEERIHRAIAAGKVSALLGSQVTEILPDAVRIAQPAGEQLVPNDFVIVLAGGVLPFAPLREAGVRFGREADAPAPVARR